MQYSPVKVVNPLSQQILIKLLKNQKLIVYFTKPEFYSCQIQVSGTFLKLEEIEKTSNGWFASISQNLECEVHVSLFLGEVTIYNQNGIISSLCVVSLSQNPICLRVIDPSDNNLRIESQNVLDIVFYSIEHGEHWSCGVDAGVLSMQLIDRFKRLVSPINIPNLSTYELPPVEEHCFRFRLSNSSVDLIKNFPKGHYDAGNLFFFKINDNLQKSNLKITCNLKGEKGTIIAKKHESKLLLFEKRKQLIQTKITLRKIEFKEIDEGCNIIFSKVHHNG